MASGFRKYLFAGDAGISQATQVPSMAGQGDDKVLKVVSDVNAFGCWQNVVLDDNIYETYRQEVLPVVNNWARTNTSTTRDVGMQKTRAVPSFDNADCKFEGKVVFQFELMGMTQMKRIFLDYCENLRLFSPMALASNVTWKDKTEGGCFLFQQLNGMNPSDLPQSEFTMLNGIKRIQFLIGKEKLIFEDGTMESLNSRKVHMCSLNYSTQEAAQIAKLGLRYAKNVPNQRGSDFFSNSVPMSTTDPGRVPLVYEVDLTASAAHTMTTGQTTNFRSLDPNAGIFDNFIQSVISAPKNRKVVANLINVDTPKNKNCPITVPLFCLIPFLAQSDSFLPKGVPIEIRIDFEFTAPYVLQEAFIAAMFLNTYPVNPIAPGDALWPILKKQFRELYQTWFGADAGTDDTQLLCPFFVRDTSTGEISATIRLVYDYFVLKENIQKEFNLTWIQQPLLYNYYKWRRYDVKDQQGSNSKEIFYNLLINQQRPLAVLFRYELLNQDWPNKLPNDTQKGNSFYYAPRNLPVTTAYAKGASRELAYFSTCPIFNYKTGSCIGPKISDLEIAIGSQTIYKATTRTGNNDASYTVHSVMDNMNQCNRDNGTNFVQYASLHAELAQFDNATPYKVVLTQSKTYERGMYALDRGNTNLTFRIRMDEELKNSDNLTLAMYAIYPAQMTIDKSYTAVESQWPVIIAENGPVVQSMYNIN